MNGDQSEDIRRLYEKSATQAEQILALQEWSKGMCTWKLSTIPIIQKHEDYCRGREHLPDDLIDTQDELMKLRHAFEAYVKDYEKITKPKIDTLYNLVMRVIYTVGAATFIMACIVGYTTLSGLFE